MSTIADPRSNKVRLDEHQARFPNRGVPWTNKAWVATKNHGGSCLESFAHQDFEVCLEAHATCCVQSIFLGLAAPKT